MEYYRRILRELRASGAYFAPVYVLEDVSKDGDSYDISNATLWTIAPKVLTHDSGFHHITDKGWQSKKRVIANFAPLHIEQEVYKDENGTDCVYLSLLISANTAEELLKNYTGGKYYISAAAMAESRNAGAWCSIASNHIHDPCL